MKRLLAITLPTVMTLCLAFSLEGGEWYGAVEGLYWEPLHLPVIAGRQIGPDDGVTRPRENLLITGSYDWGIQAQVGYDFCPGFVDLSYLYFHSSSMAHYTAAPGSVIRMPSGAPSDNLEFLRSKISWEYTKVDVRAGYYLARAACWSLYGYGKGEWVKINFRNLDTGIRFTPNSVPDSFLQESDFEAGGVGFGLGTRYQLWHNFGVQGSCGFLVLFGDLNHNLVRFFEPDVADSELSLEEASDTYALPAIEFCLSIRYLFSCSCIQIIPEIGYQCDYYFSAVRHNIGIDRDAADDVPILGYFNGGFGGPYIRLALTY